MAITFMVYGMVWEGEDWNQQLSTTTTTVVSDFCFYIPQSDSKCSNSLFAHAHMTLGTKYCHLFTIFTKVGRFICLTNAWIDSHFTSFLEKPWLRISRPKPLLKRVVPVFPSWHVFRKNWMMSRHLKCAHVPVWVKEPFIYPSLKCCSLFCSHGTSGMQ